MLQFEWDAALVFDDPFALAVQDRVEDNECRWQTIGQAGNVLLLLVAHAVQADGVDETIRIISARRANRKECNFYEENRKEATY